MPISNISRMLSLMDATQIGPLIETLRREAGLTQAELARRLETTQAAISKIETGRSLPSLTVIERIARAIGRPITITLGGTRAPLSRKERKERVRRVLGDDPFDPWDRNPTVVEQESLLADGLTRERFSS